jgi:lipooligosaccharide transport system permease protein
VSVQALRAGAFAVWMRNFWAWRRYYRSSLLLNFGEPITNLLALGLGLGAYVARMDGMSFFQFIAPGLLSVTAMNAVTFDAGFETYDKLNSNGVYQAMITSPLTVPQILAGEYLWEMCRSLLYGAIFFLFVAAFGLVHSWWALLLPVPLALTGILFTAPALWVAARARTHEQLFYYFTLVITPMFMISGVFFPVHTLPAALATFVRFLPLYHTVQLSRELLLGQIGLPVLINLLWLLGYALVLVWVPRRAFEQRLVA